MRVIILLAVLWPADYRDKCTDKLVAAGYEPSLAALQCGQWRNPH